MVTYTCIYMSGSEVLSIIGTGFQVFIRDSAATKEDWTIRHPESWMTASQIPMLSI